MRYKEKYELPDDKAEADWIWSKAPIYEVVDRWLYKRSFGVPLLRCLLPNEAKTMMEETHRGIFTAHQDANTLARKLVI